jgi:hypothetical protein
MTFREKSVVAQIAAIIAVYGFFAVRHWRQPPTQGAVLGVLIGITIWMIIISVVSHIAIAAYRRPEKQDERDLGVRLRGSRNGYLAIGVGVWGILMLAMIQTPYGLLCYAILAAFALAEIVRLASQLYYYRFGL